MADEKENSTVGISDPMNMRNSDTGHLKRLTPQGADAAPAAGAAPSDTVARRTIKLKPLPKPGAAPAGMPSVHIPNSDQPAPTVLIQRNSPAEAAAPAAAHASSLPGVKQTIKLRPSSVGGVNPPAPVTPMAGPTGTTIKLSPMAPSSAPASPAGQTIRLVPNAPAPASAPGGLKPSSPTIKLVATPSAPGAPAVPLTATVALNRPSTTPSATTLKLSPNAPAPASAPGGVKPSSPTINLQGTQVMGGAERPKISLKAPSTPGGMPPSVAAAQGTEPKAPALAKKADKDEPSIVFGITAIVALIAIIYGACMTFFQYNELWMK